MKFVQREGFGPVRPMRRFDALRNPALWGSVEGIADQAKEIGLGGRLTGEVQLSTQTMLTAFPQYGKA